MLDQTILECYEKVSPLVAKMEQENLTSDVVLCLCNAHARERRCSGALTRSRKVAPCPSQHHDNIRASVREDSSVSSCSSVQTLVTSHVMAIDAVSAAAAATGGQIASMNLRSERMAVGNGGAAASAVRHPGTISYGGFTSMRPGEYHRTDAALMLRNDLVRQRRTTSIAPAVPPSPPSLPTSPSSSSSSSSSETAAALSAATHSDNPAAAAAAAAQLQQQQQLYQQYQQQQQQLEVLQQRLHDRSIVVGDMAQYIVAWQLTPATFFLAFELMDCYLAKQTWQLPHSMMRLLALACFSVACGMEEEVERSYTIVDWAALAADQAADFGQMKHLLLETLGWRTLQPTKYGILQHLLLCVETDPWVAQQCGVPERPDRTALAALKAVSEFLAELTLSYGEIQQFQPSTVAVTCVSTAIRLLRQSSGGSSSVGGSYGGIMDIGSDDDGDASGAAAAADGAAEAAAAAGHVVSALAAAAGVDEQTLAPGFRQCFEMLEYLYDNAMWWVIHHYVYGDGAPQPVWLPEAVIRRHESVVSALIGLSPLAAVPESLSS